MTGWDHLNGISSPLKSQSDSRLFCVFWDFHLCVVVCVCDFEKLSPDGIRKGGLHGPEVALHISSYFYFLAPVRTHIRVPSLQEFIESNFLHCFCDSNVNHKSNFGIFRCFANVGHILKNDPTAQLDS